MLHGNTNAGGPVRLTRAQAVTCSQSHNYTREQQALQRRLARTPGDDLGARPTKQARRRLDALRRGQGNSRRD